MKQILFIAVLSCMACYANSQLYMPRDVASAYKKGTRSTDGKPGKNYWQNHAEYIINVTAMPPDSIVSGHEEIMYHNESPDTVRNPVFRLLLNIHKPGAPRESSASPDYLTAGVTIDSFYVNGKAQPWRNIPSLFTWMPQTLSSPLLPKDSVHFTIAWHYEISKQSGREGKIDSTSYFLAYFYPRVAVFDDYNDWDRMTFTDSKEFYSDFNDYTVTVNVPKNYIVWGTGTLQKPETVLQPDVLKRYQQSITSDEVINIVTQKDLDAKNVTAQNTMNTWLFTSKNIPDVAFGISDHFVWDGCSAIVDDATKRRAAAYAAYNDTAKDYHRVAAYAQHSLSWLSHNWPGVPYPYEKTTVFHGYAGMEYPMMANDETYEDTAFSRFVAEHEIAHTYMPFYMGINESRYGFMDEGWATTFEYLIGTEDLGKETATQLFKQFRVDGWINDKSAGQDIPIITPTSNLTGPGYGNNEYGKPALGYLAVKDMLADDMFRKCLHAYMDRWHGKHPLPWDFFYTFNNVSGKDLNWFWNNWFFQNNYIDLAVKSVTKNGKGYDITIDNIGGMAAPFNVWIDYADGTKDSLHQTSAVWEKDLKSVVIKVPAKKSIQSLKIDGEIFMDADYSDNNWQAKP